MSRYLISNKVRLDRSTQILIWNRGIYWLDKLQHGVGFNHYVGNKLSLGSRLVEVFSYNGSVVDVMVCLHLTCWTKLAWDIKSRHKSIKKFPAEQFEILEFKKIQYVIVKKYFQCFFILLLQKWLCRDVLVLSTRYNGGAWGF